MIIVYNSDERFASIFATSVVSLFESNKKEKDITVYLIENGISSESKTKFQLIAKEYEREIITLPMPDIEKAAGVDVVIPKYNRMATCGRLFIASLLPDNIDKVIYVDCDTIFVRPIKELWETDISQYAVVMVDCGQHVSLKEQIGISPDGEYFNSGLLLINLRYWREQNVEKAFMRFINNNGGFIPFPDEGVLNAVFDGKIFMLPLIYNVFSQIYSFTYDELFYIRKLKHFYNREEYEYARENPVMVHFTSNFYMSIRPWVKGCVHPYVQEFIQCRNKTPWNNEPLWEDTRQFLNKAYTKYCNIVPRPLMLWTSKIIVVYLRPMIYRYKRWRSMRANKESIRILSERNAS